MNQRLIEFHMIEGGDLSETMPRYAGVKGEHNATAVAFVMTSDVFPQDTNAVRMSFRGGDGTVFSTDLLEPLSDNVHVKISYALPKTITMLGGQIEVRLVLSYIDENGKETALFQSSAAILYFEDAAVENGTPFWTGVSEMLKNTRDSVETVRIARDEVTACAKRASGYVDAAQQAAETAQGAHRAAQAVADSINGASAYGIAVKNGFEGDEAAWLASLKGDKGERGEKGGTHIQEAPLFASRIADCTDTTKVYVLPDGYIYGCVEEATEGGTTADFTNQLPVSTGTDGAVYNGVGYKDATRLSSSGADSAGVATYATGFIPCKAGDVVRFENFGFSDATVNDLTASNQRVVFYNSNKTFICVTNATGVLTSGQLNGVAGDDGNIVQFTVGNFATYDLSNAAYFRINGHYIGVDTIITVNEEITYTTTEGGVAYTWVNTGHAFVPASVSHVSDAVRAAASAVVDKAMSHEDNRLIRFLVSADAHQNNAHTLITKGTEELGNAQSEILTLIGVDFVANLGDVAWGAHTDTVAEVVEQIKTYKRLTASGIKGERQLWCEGNHDDGNYSLTTYPDTPKLTASALNTLLYSEQTDMVYDPSHMVDGYGYVDFASHKVRVICLNTEQGEGDGGVVAGYQLKWFAETALDMTDKADWSVITLAHHPLGYPMPTLFKDCVNIVDAFISGSTIAYTTSDGTEIRMDFSGRNCSYVGHFHGHAHAFSVVPMQKYVDGVYVDLAAYEIGIPNACYTRTNQYLGNENERLARYATEATYDKSDEDGLRTSFNLVTVCLDSKTVYADHYGAGIDRVIRYGE